MKKTSLIPLTFLLSGIVLIIIGVLLINQPTKQTEDNSSSDWFNESLSFTVPAGEYVTKEKELSAGLLKVIFNVTRGGHIKFLALNESNYLKWMNGHYYQAPFPITDSPTFQGEIIFGVTDGTWFFVWDNSYDSTNYKEIRAFVTYSWSHMLDR